MMFTAAGLVSILLVQPVGGAGESVDFLTGPRATAALETPLTGSWQNIEFRPLIQRISHDRRLAVLLDRRIDPNRMLSFESRGQSVREAFAELAESADGGTSSVGSSLVIAPPEAANRLRTLVYLRTEEFRTAARGKSADGKSRLLLLTDRNTVRWNDLEEPRQLVERIAARWKLSVAGVEAVPHDLWAGSTLPEVNAVEALSLVLNQFDLTFEWAAGGGGVKIVPVPERVEVEKKLTPRGIAATDAARQWRDEIAGLIAEPMGKDVLVRGTLEQIEQVESLLKPGVKPTSTSKPKPGVAPLARRTFTLRTQSAPASAVLEKLKQSGIDVRFDAEALKAAGVTTEKSISLDLNKATAAELFAAICSPIGAKFRIVGETVEISAK